MIASFNIFTPVADTAECSLFVAIGPEEISYCAVTADNTCFALSIFHFDTGTCNENAAIYLKDIVAGETLLQQNFKKISIIYNFSESLLVPDKYMNAATNEQMLELVYGNESESITSTDFIAQLNLHNVYRLPGQVDAVVDHLFSGAGHCHLYTLLQGMSKKSGNHLYCIFGTSYIIVQLMKEGRLQVIQHFNYKVPEDAAYYLLNVCERFEAPVIDTEVVLNGMIDAASVLCNELSKYFPLLSFGILPGQLRYDEGIKKYPAHYFSHLFETVVCVS